MVQTARVNAFVPKVRDEAPSRDARRVAHPARSSCSLKRDDGAIDTGAEAPWRWCDLRHRPVEVRGPIALAGV